MNEAVAAMLRRYDCRSAADYEHALREILQEIALLGLWRSKFFDKAAFYGGTALRILNGLDRFSENLYFSLLSPVSDFNLAAHLQAIQKELGAFGFDVSVEQRHKAQESPVLSAFLKADTVKQFLVVEVTEEVARQVPRGKLLKIRFELDTDPSPGFSTHTSYLLQPIPFALRVYELPDLFAGKMHAILCRRWKNRVKGRDWYDLVWYAANHPVLHLEHLEQRLRQSGDWRGREALTAGAFRDKLKGTIDRLDVDQARREVEPFVKNPGTLAIWSKDFFRDVAARVEPV